MASQQVLVGLCVLAWTVSGLPVGSGRVGETLTFFDDFSGSFLNESQWNVLNQVHRGGVYSRDNAWVQDGLLVLRTVSSNQTIDGTDYYVASGAVNTSGLFEQRQGRFEVRAKMPDVDRSSGYTLHSSIWLIAHPGASTCPQELDIVEQYAADPYPSSKVQGNIHAFGPSPACTPLRAGAGAVYSSTDDFTTDFHVFSLEWADDHLTFAIDGLATATYTNSSIMESLTEKQFLALTACVMDRVPVLSSDAFPLFYYIDWVKVWSF